MFIPADVIKQNGSAYQGGTVPSNLFPNVPQSISNLTLWLRADMGMTYGTSPVVAAGTTPPAVTLSGTPVDIYSLQINITTSGALGVAIFKWSIDGGSTFTTGVTTAATVVLGSTGVTANFATGTYATDNVYTSFSTVAQWNDQSGTGDTNKNASQVTAALQPKALKSDVTLNNTPSLSFAGAQKLLTGTWTNALVQPCTVVIAAKSLITSNTNDLQLLDGLDASHRIALLGNSNSSSDLALYTGTSVITTTNIVNVAFATVASINGASTNIYVNKKSAPVTGNPGSQGVLGFTIGDRFASIAGVAPWTGSIAEIIVYNTALSSTNAGRLLDYLGTRYGISIAA